MKPDSNPKTQDQLKRSLRDLRISVTDRCNLRCNYCMPAHIFDHQYDFLPKDKILSYEEITKLVTIFVELGVKKLRITGGEPLLRRDLPTLIKDLAQIPGIEDLALTTNGLLLPQLAAELKSAGLTRLTISLDTLDQKTFQHLTSRNFPIETLFEGIETARQAGFGPIKINTVIQRGINDHEILAIAKRFRGTGDIVRFIEFMDVGNSNGWQLDRVVPAREILARIHEAMPLKKADPRYHGEVASRYSYADDSGEEIGVIASVTQPFCASCGRARLSAQGELYTCLFASKGHDLKSLLRSGASQQDLKDSIAKIWEKRHDRYSEKRSQLSSHPKVEMSYIGG